MWTERKCSRAILRGEREIVHQVFFAGGEQFDDAALWRLKRFALQTWGCGGRVGGGGTIDSGLHDPLRKELAWPRVSVKGRAVGDLKIIEVAAIGDSLVRDEFTDHGRWCPPRMVPESADSQSVVQECGESTRILARRARSCADEDLAKSAWRWFHRAARRDRQPNAVSTKGFACPMVWSVVVSAGT